MRSTEKPAVARMCAASSGRDPDLTEFRLGLAREDLDLLPDLELVLQLPDAGHLGAGVARDHGRVLLFEVARS